VIDVDILLFGEERISEEGLKVPHPGISLRPFVLESLSELGVKPAGRW
jgi:2-amino-4-hydroxy-6-hydroxymethyldihydropteridine diphosphokinase